MRNNSVLKRIGIVLVSMFIILPTVNAQARYKHLPRVKADARKTEVPMVVAKEINPTITTTAYTITDLKINLIAEEEVTFENITFSANTKEIVLHQKKTPDMMRNSPIAKIKNKSKSQPFGDQIKKESKVLHIKEAHKTALLGYIIWFIFLLVLAVALFTLTFVFLYLLAFTLHYIFLTIAIVALLASALILILGITGVI